MVETVPVIANAGGGTARAAGGRLRERIEAAFAEAGVRIALALVDGDRLAGQLKASADAPLVVVGGGDGTLGTAASLLAARGGTLGILPLGTHNHLAAELGIPFDLGAAARLIAGGPTRRIDLGSVNGHGFVNNASIGLYPALVRRRESVQARRGWPKWLANVPAATATLRRLRHHRLRVRIGAAEEAIATPVLFVGNNRYSLAPGEIGQRAALDDGVLSIYAVHSGHRRALIGSVLRTMLGRADPDRDFALLGEAPALRVDGHGGTVSVALDGEVVRLSFPLAFEVKARTLHVIAPSA